MKEDRDRTSTAVMWHMHQPLYRNLSKATLPALAVVERDNPSSEGSFPDAHATGEFSVSSR